MAARGAAVRARYAGSPRLQRARHHERRCDSALRSVVVAADLREDSTDALRDAGFRGRVRSAWLAGGLIAYLADEDAQWLLRRVGDLARRSSALALDQPTIPEQWCSRAPKPSPRWTRSRRCGRAG